MGQERPRLADKIRSPPRPVWLSRWQGSFCPAPVRIFPLSTGQGKGSWLNIRTVRRKVGRQSMKGPAMSALKIKKGSSKPSAYNLRPNFSDVQETHTIAVLVENEPGVLARVIGLFSGRGYNIDSLTVAEVDHEGHLI